MKALHIKDRVYNFVLYIPHGSDESLKDFSYRIRTWTLYPTWFRWKILKKCIDRYGYTSLYPTWFRWKIADWTLFISSWVTFISHMVQMKVTEKDIVSLKEPADFISHMVQMKGYFLKSFFRGWKTLYPTWFRWKKAHWQRRQAQQGYFISHMVQMKALKTNVALHSLLTLYPTWFRWKMKKWRPKKFFKFTLYPTWFRWKKSQYQAQHSQNTTFISHMVQMKVGWLVLIITSFESLYPTWFRWKLITVYRLYTRSRLYIPHGSDERSTPKTTDIQKFNLYIPHGSDERSLSSPLPLNLELALYPTWFRWKVDITITT